jgi:hypothetical protein
VFAFLSNRNLNKLQNRKKASPPITCNIEVKFEGKIKNHIIMKRCGLEYRII